MTTVSTPNVIKGTDVLGYTYPFITLNGDPLCIRTKSGADSIFLMFTKKYNRLREGFCFDLPLIFMEWWVLKAPFVKIVCQTKEPKAWYWLKLDSLTNKQTFKDNNTTYVRIGLQYFNTDMCGKYITPRKFRCLKKS